MSKIHLSRRNFLGASATGTAAGALALTDPALAAAQAVGVKRGDLPDLTIKEVKVYVVGRQRVGSVVTNSGIEGNHNLDRGGMASWDSLGWLDNAKRRLLGKSAIDLPLLTSQWDGEQRR